jgi:hypothetical protein
MFALMCILTFFITCLGACYLGDYCGRREAEKREGQIIKEQAQKIKDQEKIIKVKEQKLKEKTTTLYPCGAKVINEKGETIDVLLRNEAVLMHFLLTHQDQKMSTAELSKATDIPLYLVMEMTDTSLRQNGWVCLAQSNEDYYSKVLLTDEGKKIFLEAF